MLKRSMAAAIPESPLHTDLLVFPSMQDAKGGDKASAYLFPNM